MFAKTLDHFAQVASDKAAFAREKPSAFFISSMMAGAYVGIGIILIFTLGQQSSPPFAAWSWAPVSASR
jgi:nitrite transporter NirC